MEIDFNSYLEEYNKYEDIYLDILNKTIAYLKLDFIGVVSVSFVDEKTIKQLNNDYRHIDRVTDVISFAFNDGEDREYLYHSQQLVALGDIYICLPRALEQAKEYGHSEDREIRFLFVHGLLHLLGYDHQTPAQEEIMFPLQEEILKL